MNDSIFPVKRQQKTKNLEEGFNFKEIENLTDQIAQFLMTKAVYEFKKQDKSNPTELGGTHFWLEQDAQEKVRLHFNKHPNNWNVKEIVKEMNNREADIIMERQFNLEHAQNPFSY